MVDVVEDVEDVDDDDDVVDDGARVVSVDRLVVDDVVVEVVAAAELGEAPTPTVRMTLITAAATTIPVGGPTQLARPRHRRHDASIVTIARQAEPALEQAIGDTGVGEGTMVGDRDGLCR